MLPHCRICDYRRAPIEPSGPLTTRIMAVGEGPARDEVRHGYPFAGRSGLELDEQYLPAAGLSRSDVRVTNAKLCPCPGFRNPTPQQALACSREHLARELETVKPLVVITLGSVAASVFNTMPTLGRPIHLELDHGRPVRATFGGWSGWVVSQYHPAAAMHQGDLYGLPLQADFRALRNHLRVLLKGGTPALPVDEFPVPDYRELRTGPELADVLSTYERPGGDVSYGPAVDTESDSRNHEPYSLQISLWPGTGYVIRADNHKLLGMLSRWLRQVAARVLFHHALADLDACRRMGVEVDHYEDTLMHAYWAQGIPLGLKPLAYRLCGMEMQDYNDLVTPYSREKVLAWARRVRDEAGAAFQVSHVLKSGPRKEQTEMRWAAGTDPDARDAHNRVVALLRDVEQEGDEPVDPWKRWDDWRPAVRSWCEALGGGTMPEKSIVHVPEGPFVWYAGRDPDATLRVYPRLKALAEEVYAAPALAGGL